MRGDVEAEDEDEDEEDEDRERWRGVKYHLAMVVEIRPRWPTSYWYEAGAEKSNIAIIGRCGALGSRASIRRSGPSIDRERTRYIEEGVSWPQLCASPVLRKTLCWLRRALGGAREEVRMEFLGILKIDGMESVRVLGGNLPR